MDNMFREELEKFQNDAAELQGMLSDLAGSRPDGAEAADAQGSARVRVGGDGLPKDITAASDWERRCKTGGLGTAVVEAARNATHDLMNSWSQDLPTGPWDSSSGMGTMGVLMTGVGAVAAGGIFLEGAAFNATVIGAAFMAALAALLTQKEELNRIKGEAQSVSDFPGPPVGNWPNGTR
ncbi:hypothetical protein [Streptomyces sp. NPDC017993]|uniref:hypothetical protein n=1 Tax=Streptomyces sp. NPDC017993 TaxID=3365027 RepID=UPI0037A93189